LQDFDKKDKETWSKLSKGHLGDNLKNQNNRKNEKEVQGFDKDTTIKPIELGVFLEVVVQTTNIKIIAGVVIHEIFGINKIIHVDEEDIVPKVN
jgi:hypothetical protein